MKFGIFYELQLPRPWLPGGELQLYQNALDQVELADRLGYDYAWEVEHHFLEEYSHSSAPEVFLAAASQRTKRIRLAHGIMQLTTTHPARCAERIAALDLVSNGRVEFGTGESASVTELEPFGVAFDEKRAIWEEAIRAIIPMFGEGGVEHHGKYFDMPLRNVLPKPVQKPHPPLWVACSQLETIEMAGRRGLGALAFQFLSADAAHAWVHAYYNAFTKRQQKLADYVTNPNLAITSYFMCAETDDEARRRADESVGRVREVEARQPRGAPPGAVRRADRLARDAAPETAQIRDLADRLGDPLKPGRQEHPRAHLREPRIVRARGHAGIPRPYPRARGVEAKGAGARDRARGNRHPAVPRPLRPQFGAAQAGPGGGVG
jgi:alkanesulfonate monooxygenase SsuD/methylene tetrahydromethanopterin reductase-like flavin-dependent oxidoreductase (luciferase family)